MVQRTLRSWAPAAVLSLLAWAPATAWSQDLGQLEQDFRRVARESIPKTVLIKALVRGERMGAGSGAIISADGYILTCTHVVEIGDGIEVVTPDGTSYPAKLLGRNNRQDYALVKIEAEGLPAFTMADSDTVQPGDWVMALGHPGGPYADLQPAFAAGRVRDLDRKLPVDMMRKFYNHAIMTDVPIFAGDSGGPLVNLQGELVGINGAIVAINELAFAIPMNQIAADLERLKAGTTIEGEPPGPDAMKHMQDLVSPEDYQRMMRRSMKNLSKMFGGEDSPFGKLFGEDSPFGDMSQLFGEDSPFGELFGGGGNGEMPDFSQLFGEDSPLKDLFGGGGGNGEMPDLSKLFEMFGGGGNGELPDLGKIFGEGSPFGDMFGGQNPFGQPPRQRGPRGFLGVRADPQQAPGLGGVLITEVVSQSPAQQAGMLAGDLVVSVDGVPTGDLRALQRAVGTKPPGTAVKLGIRRAELVDGLLIEREQTLSVTLGKAPR